jgi:hypothetical protein
LNASRTVQQLARLGQRQDAIDGQRVRAKDQEVREVLLLDRRGVQRDRHIDDPVDFCHLRLQKKTAQRRRGLR